MNVCLQLYGPSTSIAFVVIPFIVVMFVIIVIWATRYRQAPPDAVMLVSGGAGKEYRLENGQRIKLGYRVIQPGSGTFIWPVIERVDFLSLALMQIDNSFDTYTADSAPLAVAYAAQAKVGGDVLSIARAAERFLSKEPREIAVMVQLIVDNGVRTALSGMGAADLALPRGTLAARLQAELAPRLGEAGIILETLVLDELVKKE